MNYAMPTDCNELEWLTDNAIDAHCSASSGGKFSLGFGVWYTVTVSHLLSETNHVKGSTYSGKILPLLGALSALDQYGYCYELDPPIFPAAFASKSSIIKVVHNFLNIPVNSPDSDALYALRNSLVHQSSLISVSTLTIPKHHWFEIDNSIENIFLHPANAWDGIYNTRTDSNKTIVNASKVVELVFSLIDILKKTHQKKKLRIALKGGLAELLTSYVSFEFQTSLHDSYISYLGGQLYTACGSSVATANDAKKVLSSKPRAHLQEAARWLVLQPGGLSLRQINSIYPSLLP
ncbi:hypothetical protein [Pseudomonas syringae group genomosp. 3]|uniref:hypothetical protein n=1 Tax=Pseudomonas syringae group genomosp. 3 TaxID=251701 RepID=UPI0011C3AF5D|nr:hypothetical protein [Pseudomonas syringae group genomosp. 3]